MGDDDTDDDREDEDELVESLDEPLSDIYFKWLKMIEEKWQSTILKSTQFKITVRVGLEWSRVQKRVS